MISTSVPTLASLYDGLPLSAIISPSLPKLFWVSTVFIVVIETKLMQQEVRMAKLELSSFEDIIPTIHSEE